MATIQKSEGRNQKAEPTPEQIEMLKSMGNQGWQILDHPKSEISNWQSAIIVILGVAICALAAKLHVEQIELAQWKDTAHRNEVNFQACKVHLDVLRSTSALAPRPSTHLEPFAQVSPTNLMVGVRFQF